MFLVDPIISSYRNPGYFSTVQCQEARMSSAKTSFADPRLCYISAATKDGTLKASHAKVLPR